MEVLIIGPCAIRSPVTLSHLELLGPSMQHSLQSLRTLFPLLEIIPTMPPSLLTLQLCCNLLGKAFITTTGIAQTAPNTPLTHSPGTKDPSVKVVGMVVLVRIFVPLFDECISLSLAYNLPKIGILLNFAHCCYLQHLAQ